MDLPRPLRILHVVFSLNRGGIESWLVALLRHINRKRFQVDVLAHTAGPNDYEKDLENLGIRITHIPPPTRLYRHARAVLDHLRTHGPYDVVHSHVTFTGYLLRLARRLNVPVRIAHSHCDRVYGPEAGWPQRLFLRVTHPWIMREATAGLTPSRSSAPAFFGSEWERDSRWIVHPYGIDLTPFHDPVDSISLRRSLGLPDGAPVIGHVGRFFPQKNHAFLLEVMQEVMKRDPHVQLLLVGDGPLRSQMETTCRMRSLHSRIRFAGSRKDVPHLMRGAMDLFLLPSLFEGLPLVGIEAQAAGLPCLWSDTITPEVTVVPELVHRLSLNHGPSDWAETLLNRLATSTPLSREEALQRVEQCDFNIQRGAQELERLYDRWVQATPAG